MTLARVLRASLLAGVVAGLAVALFHFVATEPLVERAIALEEAKGGPAEEVFARTVQRGGLFGGFLLYGLSLGLLFAGVFSLLAPRLPGESPARKAEGLALLALWAVALFPFLKYPANPPAVGDPATVYHRQGLYLLFLGLSVGGVAGSWALLVRLGRGGLARWRWPLALGAYGVYAVIIYLVMPASPDPVEVPADLLVPYRALSAGGLVLFWLVFGGAFGPLWRLLGDREAMGRHPAGPR